MTEFDPIDVTTHPEDDDPESLAGGPVEDLNEVADDGV
jgi:hypothetical protein